MSAHTPHELHDEFPRDARVLHLLKLADTHFCNLAERYHALNRAIHRIECEVETTSDTYLTRLRRQRLALLDEIAAIIEEAEGRYDDPAGDTPTPPAAGLIFGAPPKTFGEAANDQAVPA
ncbi:MAG: YdcH family protein [Pseudomonadota bacterium]